MVAPAQRADARTACCVGSVPAELIAAERWLGWTYEHRDGRETKVPRHPRSGRVADANDPACHGDFHVAFALAHCDGTLGIGFAFVEGDGWCGIDLDDCVDEQGVISDPAMEIIESLGSYSEFSPSGTGVKIFVRGVKPSWARCRSKAIEGVGEIEIYDRGRYFAVTGRHVPGTPTDVRDAQEALETLCARLWGRPEPRASLVRHASSPLSRNGVHHRGRDDDDIIARARGAANGAKFEALFDRGDTSGYGGDDSSADEALACILAFYSRDAAQIERIMSLSALGQREKWRDRADYRERTIDAALRFVPPPTPSRSGMRLQPLAKDADGEDVPCTDLGNAQRFAARCRDSLRYCPATGVWYVWDGTRWCRDELGTPLLEAGRTARDMLAEAARCDNEAARAHLARWAIASEARPRLEAMVALARSHPDLAITTDRLDADIWAFNTRGGTIDLRTGVVRPHRRDDLITKVAPVEYHSDAACPLWEAFLERIMGGDAAVTRYLQRFFGYCLSGAIDLQYLPILHGVGANGKSVFVDTIKGAMGEYACDAPPSLLVRSGREEHPTEIADLLGRRLVVASETEDGAAFKIQFVKRLTGDATLKGRFMRQDFFSFGRTHKTVLVTNNKPRVAEDSEAVWRRLHLVPFDVVIPPGERDPQLMEKLSAEWPGIVAWLVRGCLACQRDGLAQPEAVSAATAVYRATEDALGRFFEDCCEIDPEGTPGDERSRTPFGSLYAAYKAHCEAAGERPLGTRRFGMALDKRGITGATARYDGQPTKVRDGVQLVHTPGVVWRPGL